MRSLSSSVYDQWQSFDEDELCRTIDEASAAEALARASFGGVGVGVGVGGDGIGWRKEGTGSSGWSTADSALSHIGRNSMNNRHENV